jgi:hypothetical protein
MRELKALSPPELLALHAAISEELRQRQITRSSNNPVGDFSEYLFCHAFGWRQLDNSMRDVDAIDDDQVRYQIKGRRITSHNMSRQLGAIRDLKERRFDVLAAVVFHEDYQVQRAALIPHARVCELATPVERTNSFRFILRDTVWLLPDVRDVTAELQAAAGEWDDVIAAR